MILYLNCATCGYNKQLASKYRALGYEIRTTRSNPVWRKEAKEYGLKTPFKVVDGIASHV